MGTRWTFQAVAMLALVALVHSSCGGSGSGILERGEGIALTGRSALLLSDLEKCEGTRASLCWTVPGSSSQSAASYEIRYRCDGTEITESNFGDAALAVADLASSDAGASQSYVVRGLMPDEECWGAVRLTDDGGKQSVVSATSFTTDLGSASSAVIGLGLGYFARVGDLDGDGDDDFCTGGPGTETIRDYATHVGCFLNGGENPGEGFEPAFHIVGDGIAKFGHSIEIADLDGNGCDDLIIGDTEEGEAGDSDGDGDVHIFFCPGGLSGRVEAASADIVINGTDAERLGTSLCAASGGILAVSASVYDAPGGGVAEGRIVFYDCSSGTSCTELPALTITGDDTADAVGTLMACVDYDGNGYRDVFYMSDRNGDTTNCREYSVAFFNGRTITSNEVFHTESPPCPAFEVPQTLMELPDIDGDGRGEVVISEQDPASDYASTGVFNFEVMIFFGNETVDTTDRAVYTAPASGTFFGYPLVGDIDLDGHLDLVMTVGDQAFVDPYDEGTGLPATEPSRTVSLCDGASTALIDFNGDSYPDFFRGNETALNTLDACVTF